MEALRDKILNKDSSMRISLAFYDFIHNNKDWYNRIENVVSNQLKGISDYDFEFNKRLYSFFYEYIDDNNVRCCVKEYSKFYDTSKNFDYIYFDFNILNNDITKIYKWGTGVVKG